LTVSLRITTTTPIELGKKPENPSSSSLSLSLPSLARERINNSSPPSSRTLSSTELHHKYQKQFKRVERFSVYSTKVDLPLINDLPNEDSEAITFIENWLSYKDPKKAAEKIVETVVSYPSKEALFLKALENAYVKILRDNQQNLFFEKLLNIMAFNDIAPQHLICKFFNSHLELACETFVRSQKAKARTFSFKDFFSKKPKRYDNIDSASLASEGRTKFAKMIFDFYEKKQKFLDLFPVILEADIQEEEEATLLRSNFLSTQLAHIGFETYLIKPLREASEQLEQINREKNIEIQTKKFIQCGIVFLEQLKKQEFIKTVSQSIRLKVLEKFPESNNQEKFVKNILTNLIFLRTICPYFTNPKIQMGTLFAKLLNALIYDKDKILNEIPELKILDQDSFEVIEVKEKNNKEALEKNDFTVSLNKAYQSNLTDLSKLLEELLFRD